MKRPIDGILLVDKEEGELSYGVVKRVRRLLRVSKAGHAGTLDPFATGLLIVLLGQGTRLSDLIMFRDKVYEGVIRLGIETDTFDPTGNVTCVKKVPELEEKVIQETTSLFTGALEQVPPLYSAVRHKGVRAYKLARKGIKVALKKKRVFIYSFEIYDINLPDIFFRVKCSSGTYIRTLAYDFAKALGTVGHLRSLRRLKSGVFDVAGAYPSKKITQEADRDDLFKGIIPLVSSLPDIPDVSISEDLAHRIRNGYQPVWQDIGVSRETCLDTGYLKLVMNEDLVAVLQVDRDENVRDIPSVSLHKDSSSCLTTSLTPNKKEVAVPGVGLKIYKTFKRQNF